MRKNSIITVIVILIVTIIIIFVYHGTNNIKSDRYLSTKDENRTFVLHENQSYTDNSMSFDFKSFDGKWSFFELLANKKSDIIIEDNSEIDDGELYLVVLDKDYNLIAKKEINGQGILEFNAEEGKEYLLRIVGKKASGHFDIKVNSNNDFTLQYKDFFH